MDTYAFSAQVTRMSPVGLVAEGLRLDVGFAGSVTAGPLTGHRIEGVDYLLIRPDGIGVIDVRELITGPADAPGATEVVLAAHAQGYVVPPFPMPPLADLLDPSFSWPDLGLPLHGSVRLQSAAPLLSDVNHTVFAFTGTVNMSSGTLLVSVRSIAAGSSDTSEGRPGGGLVGAAPSIDR